MDNAIVAVIDSDFIPFIVCHNKKDQEEKTLDECISLCDDYISNINKAIKADYYCGFLTTGKCFRYDINPSYKANRKYLKTPKYLFDVRDYMKEKHGFKDQLGYEADDLVLSYKVKHPEYNCIIVSPDKDILNLEGIHFNPKKMLFKETSKQEASKYFWKSVICGDIGDNIKGLIGKGEKFFNTYINVDMFIENKEYLNNQALRSRVFKAYIKELGEYKGIQEFTKNYLSLKILDNVELEEIKLNEVNLSE